jgi:hypothetical protein
MLQVAELRGGKTQFILSQSVAVLAEVYVAENHSCTGFATANDFRYRGVNLGGGRSTHAQMAYATLSTCSTFFACIRVDNSDNASGWLVLEPWITPSMFYQFLGAAER